VPAAPSFVVFVQLRLEIVVVHVVVLLVPVVQHLQHPHALLMSASSLETPGLIEQLLYHLSLVHM
jgi:hypothetical protein